MKLLDKSQLNLAKVDKKFFPFFHVKNVLSIDFDPLDLVNDFPNIESGGSFPSDNLEEGNIKKLVQELEGDKFKAILEATCIRAVNRQPMFTARGTPRAFSVVIPVGG